MRLRMAHGFETMNAGVTRCTPMRLARMAILDRCCVVALLSIRAHYLCLLVEFRVRLLHLIHPLCLQSLRLEAVDEAKIYSDIRCRGSVDGFAALGTTGDRRKEDRRKEKGTAGESNRGEDTQTDSQKSGAGKGEKKEGSQQRCVQLSPCVHVFLCVPHRLFLSHTSCRHAAHSEWPHLSPRGRRSGVAPLTGGLMLNASAHTQHASSSAAAADMSTGEEEVAAEAGQAGEAGEGAGDAMARSTMPGEGQYAVGGSEEKQAAGLCKQGRQQGRAQWCVSGRCALQARIAVCNPRASPTRHCPRSHTASAPFPLSAPLALVARVAL